MHPLPSVRPTEAPRLSVRPIPSAWVDAVRAGGPDDNGQPPERAVSDGDGVPCRHCLRDVPAGREMLILAHRPFAGRHAYAETGPIFLCADACAPWKGPGLPPILATSPAYMLRGYSAGERIVYGTGGVVPAGEIVARAAALLARAEVEEVHVRSAANGCFQCRIAREGA